MEQRHVVDDVGLGIIEHDFPDGCVPGDVDQLDAPLAGTRRFVGRGLPGQPRDVLVHTAGRERVRAGPIEARRGVEGETHVCPVASRVTLDVVVERRSHGDLVGCRREHPCCAAASANKGDGERCVPCMASNE